LQHAVLHTNLIYVNSQSAAGFHLMWVLWTKA